jgi:cell division protein FtsN
MPGWVWMLSGLAVGLSVSAVIYFRDNPPGFPARKIEQSSPVKPDRVRAKVEPEASPASRFSFYDMLPNFEVVIPEEDEAVRSDINPMNTPGIYVLQAGSYSSFADADRAKAQLAMLGVSSRVQKVSIDDKVYHRVRIGPIEDLGELNSLHQQLRQAEIEVMVIRVGE